MTDIDPATVRHALLTGKPLDRYAELFLASLLSDYIEGRDSDLRLATAVRRERDCLLRHFASRFYPDLSRHGQACAILAEIERHRRTHSLSGDAKAEMLDALCGFDHIPNRRRLQDIL